IKEYVQKYPHIIKPIYETQNQYSKIGSPYYIDKMMWSKVRGKYVALCEGDDYWISADKLQKQVDFLEAHPDFSMCVHPVYEIFADDPSRKRIIPPPETRIKKDVLTIDDFVFDYNDMCYTASIMFRWRKDALDLLPFGIITGDMWLCTLHASVGKVKFIDEVMAVYTISPTGISQRYFGEGADSEFGLRNVVEMMRFYDSVYRDIMHKDEKYYRDLTYHFYFICKQLLAPENKKYENNLLKLHQEFSEYFHNMIRDLHDAFSNRDYEARKFRKKFKLFRLLFVGMTVLFICLLITFLKAI
ncbi:MAG: hypothetical protein LBC07_02630, partial [Elusimicrobiota bacterium]|nr:hypothetical protein [Elusimicrobiota bacterium]